MSCPDLPELVYLHVVLPLVDGSYRLPRWVRTPRLQTLRISVVHRDAGNVQRPIAEFIAVLEARGPVSVELDGLALEGAGLPDGFALRPPSLSIEHFRVDRLDRFTHWDDWLAHALAQLREL